MSKHKLLNELTSSGPIYTEDDFVFCKKPNGEITSCGFRIDSNLMKKHESPFVLYHNNHSPSLSSDSNDVAQIFRNKTVPMGIFHAPGRREIFKEDIEDKADDLEIDDDLYEKLIALVDANKPSSNRKLSKKNRKNSDYRKTKKMKNVI